MTLTLPTAASVYGSTLVMRAPSMRISLVGQHLALVHVHHVAGADDQRFGLSGAGEGHGQHGCERCCEGPGHCVLVHVAKGEWFTAAIGSGRSA